MPRGKNGCQPPKPLGSSTKPHTVSSSSLPTAPPAVCQPGHSLSRPTDGSWALNDDGLWLHQQQSSMHKESFFHLSMLSPSFSLLSHATRVFLFPLATGNGQLWFDQAVGGDRGGIFFQSTQPPLLDSPQSCVHCKDCHSLHSCSAG